MTNNISAKQNSRKQLKQPCETLSSGMKKSMDNRCLIVIEKKSSDIKI